MLRGAGSGAPYATAAADRLDQTANDAVQRGLAGAVRAEQGEDIAGPYFQVDMLQRLKAGIVSFRQVRDRDDWRHGIPGCADAIGVLERHGRRPAWDSRRNGAHLVRFRVRGPQCTATEETNGRDRAMTTRHMRFEIGRAHV